MCYKKLIANRTAGYYCYPCSKLNKFVPKKTVQLPMRNVAILLGFVITVQISA